MLETADRERESTRKRIVRTVVLANVAYIEQNKTRLLGCLSQKCYHLRTQSHHKSLHIHSFNTLKCFMKRTAVSNVLYLTGKFEVTAELIWSRKKF